MNIDFRFVNTATVVIFLIMIGVWFTIFITFGVILPKYKRMTTDFDLQELLIALNAVIQTEIDIWEKNVFINKKNIDNSNFENYYEDMVQTITNSLSKSFYRNMEKYITIDAVVSIVCRKVREYLTTKVMRV